MGPELEVAVQYLRRQESRHFELYNPNHDARGRFASGSGSRGAGGVGAGATSTTTSSAHHVSALTRHAAMARFAQSVPDLSEPQRDKLVRYMHKRMDLDHMPDPDEEDWGDEELSTEADIELRDDTADMFGPVTVFERDAQGVGRWTLYNKNHDSKGRFASGSGGGGGFGGRRGIGGGAFGHKDTGKGGGGGAGGVIPTPKKTKSEAHKAQDKALRDLLASKKAEAAGRGVKLAKKVKAGAAAAKPPAKKPPAKKPKQDEDAAAAEAARQARMKARAEGLAKAKARFEADELVRKRAASGEDAREARMATVLPAAKALRAGIEELDSSMYYPKFGSDGGKAAREALNAHLGAMGLSRNKLSVDDLLEQTKAAGVHIGDESKSMTTSPLLHGGSIAGTHAWNGKIELKPEIAARARDALTRHQQGHLLSGEEHFAVKVLVHEAVHGHGKSYRGAYYAQGVVLEEGMTETVARMATSTLLGHTPTTHHDPLALPSWFAHGEGFGEPGTGRYISQPGRSYDDYIVGLLNDTMNATGWTHEQTTTEFKSAAMKFKSSGTPLRTAADAQKLFVDSLPLDAEQHQKLNTRLTELGEHWRKNRG